MKLIKKLKYILISFLALFIPIGICTWAISGAIRKEQLKAEYIVSPFTEYVLNPTSGNVIYDDTTNGSGYLGYDVSSDFTYDTSGKIIELGDPKVDRGIAISNSIIFGHSSNKDLNYSEDQFSNSSAFTNDGSVESKTRLYPNSKYATNRLYTIKLTSDVVLKDNSTLSIGAFIGTGLSYGSSGGVINGDFVCLDLNGYNLTISSGCTLNAYGYIVDSKVDKNGKHVGSIINNGTIYTGFVVEDYYGGGITVGRGFSSQMPFSLYSLPYLACKVINNYGSSIKAPTMLYANDVMNKTILNWYGPSTDYFIQSLSNGSFLVIDTYNNLSANSKTYAENFASYYEFTGQFKTNNLKLIINFQFGGFDAVTATIDMAQFAFFIPPYAHISLTGSGTTFELNMLLQFLPGSTLLVSDGTKLSFSSVEFHTDVRPLGSEILGKEIRGGQSYGGIIERSEMPPSINADFEYSDNSLYYFNYNDYKKYEIDEKEMLKTKESRIKLLGSLNFGKDGKHIVSGFIQLSDDAILDLSNNSSNINTFPCFGETFGNVTGGPSALFNWYTGDEWPTTISFGGYVIEPLVIANANNTSDSSLIGRVFNPTLISSLFSNEVYYNFRKGYFYDVANDKYYVYYLDDSIGNVVQKLSEVAVVGNIKQIDGIDNKGNIIIENNKYIYFNNTFLKTDYLSDNALTNGSGLYIYDSLTNTYNEIINMSTTYTFKAERYSIDYRGAEYLGQFEQKATIVAENKGNDPIEFWKDIERNSEVVRGNWSKLPEKNNKYEIQNSRQELGTIIDTSPVNILIDASTDLDFDIDEKRNVTVDASHLSQTAATYSNYVALDRCSCTIKTENSQPLYSEWRFNENYYLSRDETNINGNSCSDWTITKEAGVFDREVIRERTEYYDYYYFELTATYTDSNITIDNIPLYQRKISTGSSIKYDSEIDLWVKA